MMNRYKQMMEPIRMDEAMKRDILQQVQSKTQPNRRLQPGTPWVRMAGALLMVLVIGWLGLEVIRPFFSCSSFAPEAGSESASVAETTVSVSDTGEEAVMEDALDDSLDTVIEEEDSFSAGIDTGQPLLVLPEDAIEQLLGGPILSFVQSQDGEDRMQWQWQGEDQRVLVDQLPDTVEGTPDETGMIRLFEGDLPDQSPEAVTWMDMEDHLILLVGSSSDGFSQACLILEESPVVITTSRPVPQQDWEQAIQLILNTDS